jgi:hypothetical protein
LIRDLSQNVDTIATKYNIPVSDFSLLDIDLRALREFDFTRSRKLRDNSMSLVTELIESDIPKLLSVIPHTEKDLLMIAPRTSRILEPVFGRKPPKISDYIEDFKLLGPENGSVSGAVLRDHLVAKSGNLPSAALHKIWKLADADRDGQLTLSEYTVARDLIEFLKSSGGDVKALPKVLPSSYFPS